MMPKIWLNEQGKKAYPHLANEWLVVYGYDPIAHTFIIWDEITHTWVGVPTSYCEGRRDEEVVDDFDDLDLDEEWGDDGNLECGFDHYAGCYSDDC